MKNTRLKIILSVVAILLLMPFIAMQFTEEVSWTSFDFVIMGILLLGTGLTIEIVFRKVSKVSYRIAICLAILLIFFTVWAELAVGIFGSPFAGS